MGSVQFVFQDLTEHTQSYTSWQIAVSLISTFSTDRLNGNSETSPRR